MTRRLSSDYVAALVGYAASVHVRKLKRSTRGTSLLAHRHATSNRVQTNHIFWNESSVAFAYDYFETGLGDGPATWQSVGGHTVAVLRNSQDSEVHPATLMRRQRRPLPLADNSIFGVVTDPPYDNMIDYSDASDLFYVWLKRVLSSTDFEFLMTAHALGVQEKAEEAIVKRGGASTKDHRSREHYDAMMARAFSESRRTVRSDGVVTIVFGHGDPEVWSRLLAAISRQVSS